MQGGREHDATPTSSCIHETDLSRPISWPNLDPGGNERPTAAVSRMTTPEDEFRDLLGIAFECFPIGAVILGLDGRFLHVNPAFCRLLERSADELRRRRLTDFLRPDQRATFAELTVSILDRGLDNYREQRAFVRPGGDLVRLDLTGAVLKSSSGKPRAILALASEITDVAAATTPQQAPHASFPARALLAESPVLEADAATIKEGFETFCRTISREFRNPLRLIEGYADIVLEDSGEGLDAMTLRHLHTIRDQSQRLSAMIDNTVSLSRIMSRSLRREQVDMSALALDSAAVVRAELHAHDVAVRIEPDLVAVADATLAGQALRQLFLNAFRFSRAAEEPSVELGITQVDGVRAFYVRDNGAGFDMAQAYKLFQPFETLHEAGELEGTGAGRGVGLAEVERIVARHGGQVWAESTRGAGATFYFTLPDSGAAEATSPPNS